MWTIGVTRSAAHDAHDQETTRTVWDGVFTAEQAKRGESRYQEQCSVCHGTELQGDGMAPALQGPAFTANWEGLTVGDLFERIRISMPPPAPGTLSRQTIADVLAFLLNYYHMPAGSGELEGMPEKLKLIKLTFKKPERN